MKPVGLRCLRSRLHISHERPSHWSVLMISRTSSVPRASGVCVRLFQRSELQGFSMRTIRPLDNIRHFVGSCFSISASMDLRVTGSKRSDPSSLMPKCVLIRSPLDECHQVLQSSERPVIAVLIAPLDVVLVQPRLRNTSCVCTGQVNLLPLILICARA